MRSAIISLVVFCCSLTAFAQQVVIDPQHFIAVTENGIARSAAESTHDQYLGKINTNLNNLNTNMGSVVLAQNMIYQGLANVNSALKNGLEVKNMAVIVADMTGYINQSLAMAKDDPALLLFVNQISGEMRSRAIALVSEVSGYVLKEGNNVLADYNSRDQLLRKVTQQLQILDGLAYGAWKAMFWARERGIISSLNPFAGYISTDKLIVSQIIQNARYLRQN
jgi:molybdenum cofactor biosynthesis enzyme MoaA